MVAALNIIIFFLLGPFIWVFKFLLSQEEYDVNVNPKQKVRQAAGPIFS